MSASAKPRSNMTSPRSHVHHADALVIDASQPLAPQIRPPALYGNDPERDERDDGDDRRADQRKRLVEGNRFPADANLRRHRSLWEWLPSHRGCARTASERPNGRSLARPYPALPMRRGGEPGRPSMNKIWGLCIISSGRELFARRYRGLNRALNNAVDLLLVLRDRPVGISPQRHAAPIMRPSTSVSSPAVSSMRPSPATARILSSIAPAASSVTTAFLQAAGLQRPTLLSIAFDHGGSS
jgi:hypothetical protein